VALTLPGLIFNIIGVLVLMRSEWLQHHATVAGQRHAANSLQASLNPTDPEGAFSIWMLGGLSLVFGFSLHIAALFS